MNKKVFVAVVNWVKKEDGGKYIIPNNETKYYPQISIDGEYIVNGSSWSIVCLIFEKTDLYRTKIYLKYLNQEKAPDNLHSGTKIALHEAERLVAYGEIVEEVKKDF